MQKVDNLKGRKYGRWRVLRLDRIVPKIGAYWLCRCSCRKRTLKSVFAGSLKKGVSTSCGCWRSETTRKAKTKHGGHGTPEYAVWKRLRERCSNARNKSYADYGGRGIRVCRRWAKFENFLADMGERPTAKHSIERMDNDGDYSPGNCCWGTAKRQANNRRSSLRFEFNGAQITIQEIAAQTGLTYSCLHWRLRTAKMAVDAAVSLPRWYDRRVVAQ